MQPCNTFINLSATHTLHPIKTAGVSAFANVVARYPWGCRVSFPMVDYFPGALWVLRTLPEVQEAITNYKTGKLSSRAFFDQLRTHFVSLSADDFTPLPDDKARIDANKHRYACIPAGKTGPLSSEEYALVLLEEAFNAIIGFSLEDNVKWEAILEGAKQGRRCALFSFTNEANLFHLVHQLRERFPNAGWREDIFERFDPSQPVKYALPLATNLYLCPSYTARLSKTDGLLAALQKEGVMASTPHGQRYILSQYPSDVAQGKALGCTELLAEQYFSKAVLRKIWITK